MLRMSEWHLRDCLSCFRATGRVSRIICGLHSAKSSMAVLRPSQTSRRALTRYKADVTLRWHMGLGGWKAEVGLLSESDILQSNRAMASLGSDAPKRELNA